jgi:uncharacterized caspase-like protein
VLRDGRQVGTAMPPPPAKGDLSGDLLLLAPRHDHELTLLAVNRRTVSEPARVRLNWSGRPLAEQGLRPNLYVLAVGVADYPAPRLKLGFPAKDARDFTNAFRAQEGRAFGKVTARLLPDAEATRAGIEAGLDWLQASAGPEDIAIVFLAGHGVDDPPAGYHYLPYDGDMNRPAETGLSYTRLRRALGGIRANVALFIDTCHSGDVFGRPGHASMDVNRLVNDLASTEHGIVVFAASTGEQVAFESPLWGNGAFTKAVIEGLGGEAAYRGRPYISAGMLDVYVSERVKELTAGGQTPVSAKPLTLPDFQLALIK